MSDKDDFGSVEAMAFTTAKNGLSACGGRCFLPLGFCKTFF